MKVRIAPDACAEQTDWRFLDNIINKVADGWHIWQIEDPEAIEKTGWIDGRVWLKELFQKAALASAYSSDSNFPKREILVSNQAISGALPPRQAAEYATTPLTILMENRFTDGIFINIVLDVLAPNEINEQRRNAPNSIYYDSPGGIGELPKLVEDYVDRAKNSQIPVRFIVFTDSDGTIPSEIQDNAKRVRQLCEQENVPYWILNKRTIENYIPDEVLEAWIPSNPDYEKRRLVDSVKRLNSAQRDHYPMKKGLKLSQTSPAVQAFYHGISDADITELSKGFGKDVIEKLGEFRDVLTPEALRQRDGQNELDHLVELIAAEL